MHQMLGFSTRPWTGVNLVPQVEREAQAIEAGAEIRAGGWRAHRDHVRHGAG
jgi:hypothetical protein